jgi:hypothetical protein
LSEGVGVPVPSSRIRMLNTIQYRTENYTGRFVPDILRP